MKCLLTSTVSNLWMWIGEPFTPLPEMTPLLTINENGYVERSESLKLIFQYVEVESRNTRWNNTHEYIFECRNRSLISL
jgi:hypothetical protein